MFQVQGSTELISHPSSTFDASFILFFIAIKAATVQTKSEEETSTTTIIKKKKKEDSMREEGNNLHS